MANRFVSLACTGCGKEYPADTNHRCRACGGILDAQYNLDGSFPTEFEGNSIWEFADFFPPVKEENIISMGEGWTPYVETPRLARRFGLDSLWCKVEGSNPTGSFKDRAASLGVSLSVDWGKEGVFTASDGNAGVAVSAYAARAGVGCIVLVNEDVPASKLEQIQVYSAKVLKVTGLYESMSNLESALAQLERTLKGWRNLFFWAPYNPFIVDAFKTLAYEIALGDELPDLVFVPTAGGDLLHGLHKGFRELRQFGVVEKTPRLVAVQGQGADATVRAIEQGLDQVKEGGPPVSVASALRVNFGAEHAIKSVKETRGFGVSVSDRMILDAQREIAKYEGIFCEISSAASVAAVQRALETGLMARDEKVAAILTGFGLKEYTASEQEVPLVSSVASLSELPDVLRNG